MDGSVNPWLRAAKAFALIGWIAFPPAFADDDLKIAQPQLTLSMAHDELGDGCRRIDTHRASQLAPVSLHRTFHDDFDEHPLSNGRWVPHYAGGAAWPEARYWGGDGSDFKRKTSLNGEQQIYVDPRYAGRGDNAARARSVQGARWRALDRRKPHAAGTERGAVRQRVHLGHPDHARARSRKSTATSKSAPKCRSASACGRRSGCSPMTAAGRPRST